MPYVLGTRPRFVLDGIGHGWRRHVDLPGPLRRPRPLRDRPDDGPGQRPVRPGRARPRVPDHGAAHRHPAHRRRCPSIPLGGAWTGSGDNRPRAFATGSAEDVTVREYRRGDDLRRVHWRSSARVGELMVRREEQPWQSRATALPRQPRHRATAARASRRSLEARRLGRRLDRRPPDASAASPSGWSPPSGEEPRAPPGTPASAELNTGPAARGARRRPARPRSRSSTPAGSAEPAHGGLTVAVFGGRRRPPTCRCCAGCSTTPRRPGDRPRRRRRGLRTAASSPAPPRPPPDLDQGWRAVSLGPRDRLDTVWQELGRARRARADRRSHRQEPVDERASWQHAPAPAAHRRHRARWPTWIDRALVARPRPRTSARSRSRCSSSGVVLSPAPAPRPAGARLPALAVVARPARARRACLMLGTITGSPLPTPGDVDRPRSAPSRRARDVASVRRPRARPARRRSTPLLILGGSPACCWSTCWPARCAGSRWPGCRC